MYPQIFSVDRDRRLQIAVLVPCLNEAGGIANVVHDFRAALPEAEIYVYDNGSTDDTAAIAKQAGAQVRHEPLRGKGNVVRRMFADIDADVFVMDRGVEDPRGSLEPEELIPVRQRLDRLERTSSFASGPAR